MAALRPHVFDTLIVGARPAGLKHSLLFARTRGTAIVLDWQEYRNEGISICTLSPSGTTVTRIVFVAPLGSKQNFDTRLSGPNKAGSHTRPKSKSEKTSTTSSRSATVTTRHTSGKSLSSRLVQG